jgi:hypothetical protein
MLTIRIPVPDDVQYDDEYMDYDDEEYLDDSDDEAYAEDYDDKQYENDELMLITSIQKTMVNIEGYNQDEDYTSQDDTYNDYPDDSQYYDNESGFLDYNLLIIYKSVNIIFLIINN